MQSETNRNSSAAAVAVQAGRLVLRWSLVLWALGLVVYFLEREGLFPQFLFGQSDHAGAFRQVLRGVAGWGGPYAPAWDDAPWRPLGFAALALALYTVLGALLLSCFRIYITAAARVGLAFAVGVGAAGVAFELLALAGLLTRPWVYATWALLLIGSAAASLHRRRKLYDQPRPAEGWVSEQELRRSAARWYELTTVSPKGWLYKLHFTLALGLIFLISELVLLHAIGQPVTYWDSLLYYVAYGRDIFLEGKFPVKVVGQVSMGLAANYPHLFEVLAAQTAALAGEWDMAVAQLLPPVAAIAATFLVYALALEISRDRPTAISLALLFRAVPYGLSYFQYASAYAVAILLTAAFLYLAWKYVADGLPGYRDLMLLMAAFAVHVNYLMLILWPMALLIIVLAHLKQCRGPVELPEVWTGPPPADLPSGAMELAPPDHVSLRMRPTLGQLWRTRRFRTALAVALLIASPWYIRNIVVTGNPVYAFFTGLFPASKRVNPEVMRSAAVEWLQNGDGLGKVGRTLGEKLANSWFYFVTGPHHWKLGPVFEAFVLPGFLVFLGWGGWWLIRQRRRRGQEWSMPSDPADEALFRFGLASAVLFGLLWAYAYLVADYYLYQIIIVLPLFVVFGAFVFRMCSTRLTRGMLHALALLVGFAPGVIMGLMGFKLKSTGLYAGLPPPQFALTALKKPFMDQKVYYRMAYGGDMEMFDRLRALAGDAKLLTHENRFLLMEPRLRVIALDDWEVQKTYRRPADERLRILDELGITHYLYVPNEDKHAVNALVGMEELIRLGHFREAYRSRSSGATPDWVRHESIPRNMNVLYERVQ